MIIGIGIDIVEIERLEKSLKRSTGKQFLNHVYTEAEQAAAPQNERQKYAYFAGRWAAKEALSKAFGCGISSKCALRDIEILRGSAGEPQMELSGAAAQTAASLGVKKLHLSISHEREYACANVIAEG